MLKVWDIAVRLGHWALVALLSLSVFTGLTGGNWMTWHERSGVLILSIVLFRWLWGFVGATTARFGDFLHGPRRVMAFVRAVIRREPYPVAGHNPLGGWMVLALLVSITLQAVTGLFADDEILTSGPLANLVSNRTSATLTAVHGSTAWVLIGLAAVHVAAVAFHHLARREDLVTPMRTGRRPWPADRDEPDLRFRPPWLAAALFTLILVAVWATLYHLN